MKAILVIEVSDNTNFDEALADVTMQDGTYGFIKGNAGKKWHKNIKLKPMPLKELPIFKTSEQEAYIRGKNEVIDELLGE